MLLVGLWAGAFAARSAWVLPSAFLAAMLAGFASGAMAPGGVAEGLIVLSLLGLGAAAALHWKAPLPFAAAAVALFGFAHGLAHGVEVPRGAFPALFAAGFLASTALLHTGGLILGRRLPVPAVRMLGLAGAALGLVLAGSG